jgi:hypothetical protein
VVWRDITVGAAATSTLLLAYNAKAIATTQRTRFIELIRHYREEMPSERPKAKKAAVR